MFHQIPTTHFNKTLIFSFSLISSYDCHPPHLHFFFFSISFFFSHLWSFLTTDDTIAGQQSFPMPTIPLSSTTLYSLLLSFFFPTHHHPPHLSLWPPLFHLYLTSTTATMDTLSFHHPSSNGFNNMDNPHSLIFMSYI